MSLYGNDNDPNQQYAASLKALQSSDQMTRDAITAGQMRQQANQPLDPADAKGLPTATGEQQFPDSPATGGNGAQVGQPTLVGPAQENAYYPNGQSPWAGRTGQMANQSDAETSRLARMASGSGAGPQPTTGATPQPGEWEAANARIQAAKASGQPPSPADLQMVMLGNSAKTKALLNSNTSQPAQQATVMAPPDDQYEQRLQQLRALNYNMTPNSVSRPPETPAAQGGAPVPRADRNNNPGNIKYGAFAKAAGATGQDAGGFAIFPDADTGSSAQQKLLQNYAGQGLNTVAGIVSKWSPAADPANGSANTQAYIADVARQMGVDPNAPLNMQDPNVVNALKVAMAKHESGNAPMQQGQPAPQTAQATPSVQQRAAIAPANDPSKPTFVGPGGPFQMPGGYDDLTIASLRQQAMMAAQQLKLAQMRFQAHPEDPTTGQAYIQAQQSLGQAQQGYYDSQVYMMTQQAQQGNPQAFKTLFQEYTARSGTPIQLVPMGNGQYAMRAQNGTVIDTGTPHDLAATMGFALNRGAQQMSIQVQQEKAMAMAKAAPELAKAYYHDNAELLKQMGVNSSQEFQKAIETGALKTVSSNDGTVYVINPKTNQATPLGGPATGKFPGAPVAIS